MTNSAIQSMRSIDRFLQEVAATEKKAAEAHTEPGSIGGPTEHPVKDVDDSTEEAKEGFRSAENAADVKADQGSPSVENTADNVAAKKAVDGKSEDGSVNPPGTASADQLQIGTKKEPTGQDPSVETSSAKGGKEDPGSSHPARTDNGELDSLKYAEMDLDKLSKVASDLANNLLAAFSKQAELVGDQHKLDVDNDGKIEGSDLASLRNGEKKDSEKKDKEAFDIANYNKEKKESEGHESSCDDDDDDDDDKEASDLAGQAGWELAGLLSGDFDKKAADSLVRKSLVDIIKTASDDADKVAEFLASYQQEMSKQAEGEMPAGVDPSALMGAGHGEPDGDEAAMMAGPEAGGMEAGMGGDSEVEELAAVLESLGISPEELEAAMAAEAGGEGGGEMMPEGEAEPTAAETPGMEVEASAKTAAAKKGSAAKTTRDYIQEVLERSRR